MNMTRTTFKLCLATLGLAVAVAACSSLGKPKGIVASLRLHIQVPADGSDRAAPVPVFRANPVMVNVEKSPFLDERSLTNAVLMEAGDSFAIQVSFSPSGAKILEQYSTAFRTRHCAIACQWGEKDLTNRWLAAPMFNRTIFDGKLMFTPDASHEEAIMIVDALNNAIKFIQKTDAW
jgi:hypothetical protein